MAPDFALLFISQDADTDAKDAIIPSPGASMEAKK